VTFAIVGGEDAALFTIVAATGKLSFLAPPDCENPADDDGNNLYEVEVLATDGLADDNKLLQISVSDKNDAPTVNSDSIELDQNTSVAVPAPGLLSNDSDQDLDPLSVSVGSGPTNGSLILGVDGSFTYTPDDNFVGIDTFTYEVSDGAATSIGLVTVSVVEAAPMPVLPPAPAPVPEDPAEETEEEEQAEESQSNDGEVADNEPLAAPVSGRRDQGSVQRTDDLPFTGREPAGRALSVSRGFVTPVVAPEQRALRLAEPTEGVQRESYRDVPAEPFSDLSYVAQAGSYLWEEMDELAEFDG